MALEQAAILLVDDQRFVGMALGRLLDGEPDFQLHYCEKGAEALAYADRIRPALILQDLIMPDVDGLALVTTFRTHASTVATPVIVLSGNDDDATRARALAAGAVDYLVKLPSKDVLTACLRRHLAASTAGVPDMPAAPATAPEETRDHGPSLDLVLDPEVIESYRDDSADDPNETLYALIDVFLEDAGVQMDQLRAAVAVADPNVRRIAHSLKGCSMAVGATRLAAVCARLEADVDGVNDAATVGQIEAELHQVRAACAAVRLAPAMPGHTGARQ
jgi:DNA-binding response OmpR family regulator